MAIVEEQKEDGTKVHKYVQPKDDVLYDEVSSLLETLAVYVDKQKDLDFEKNVVVNLPAMGELLVRVDKRKDYFIIYHDNTEMNEIKEAALLAYWILKFKPISVKTDDLILKRKYDQINEAFAVFILYSTIMEETKRVDGMRFSISKEYNKKIMYAFKFWDLSKESIMLIAESLCEASINRK